MLNYIWGFLIVIGIVVGVLSGNIASVSEATLASTKEAVTLCITMLGIMALWTGIMQIARATGLIASLTNGIRPIIRLLFPDIPRDHVANEYIASNMIA
ncbi:MAG TPA: nucleoside recognition protein, partial [Lachnospiraceae bacterium]|nr:nucleoside recognition protein [Lachnospiraceae bacterium]